jgi:D-arabinitol dehydrogenase (NADP+)
MPASNGTCNGELAQYVIPKEMQAIRYTKIKEYSLVTMPVPEPKAHEILIKGEIISSRTLPFLIIV